MFTDRWQAFMAEEHRKDMLEQCLHDQHLRQLLGQQRSAPAYGPLLDRLGSLLITAGLTLRSRYGRLEFGK